MKREIERTCYVMLDVKQPNKVNVAVFMELRKMLLEGNDSL